MKILTADDSYASNRLPLLASKIPLGEGLRRGPDTGPFPIRVGFLCSHARRQAYGTPIPVPTLRGMGRPEEEGLK